MLNLYEHFMPRVIGSKICDHVALDCVCCISRNRKTKKSLYGAREIEGTEPRPNYVALFLRLWSVPIDLDNINDMQEVMEWATLTYIISLRCLSISCPSGRLRLG